MHVHNEVSKGIKQKSVTLLVYDSITSLRHVLKSTKNEIPGNFEKVKISTESDGSIISIIYGVSGRVAYTVFVR